MRYAGASLALLVVWLAVGAAPSSVAAGISPPVGSFGGRVDHSDAFVSLVSDGEEVRVYVCDGTAYGVTNSEWFKGALTGHLVDPVSRSGNGRLLAALSKDRVIGMVALADGRKLTFEAGRVADPAGLHAYKQVTGDEEVLAGWILSPNGEQRGAVTIGGTPSGNTSLQPARNTAFLQGVGAVVTAPVTPGNLRSFIGGQGWPP